MPIETEYLLIIYAGMVLLNTLVTGWLWRKEKTRLYLNLFITWAMLALSLLIFGITRGALYGSIWLNAPISVIAGIAIGGLLLQFIGERIRIKPFAWLSLASAVIATILKLLNLPYPIIMLLPVFSFIAPKFYGTWRILRSGAPMSPAKKGMIITAILMVLNESTIPFTSGQPELMPYVYLFTIFAVFNLSIFGPISIAEVSQAGRS